MTAEPASIGLPLESPEWEKLEHAYGECSSTVELIRDLNQFVVDRKSHNEKALTDRLTDEFSSNLFHQQSIYSATLAAVPHFAALSGKLPQNMRNEILYDVAWIHWLRMNSEAPKLEPQHQAWYDAAIMIGRDESLKYLRDMTREAKQKDAADQLWSELHVLKIAASFQGETKLAERIHWFEELSFKCVRCDELLDGRFEYDVSRYSVCRKEDAFRNVKRRVATQQKNICEPDVVPELKYLVGLAKKGPLNLAEQWSCAYFGKVECPNCDHETGLRKAS